jgi:hypothetical protein
MTENLDNKITSGQRATDDGSRAYGNGNNASKDGNGASVTSERVANKHHTRGWAETMHFGT